MIDFLAGLDPLIIGLGVIALAWIALAVQALYRAGRSSDELDQANLDKQFLREVLRADKRRPVWLWRSGQIQADSEALSMLGVTGKPSRIDDLVGNELFGLPQLLVDDLKADLSRGKVADVPATIDYGERRPRVRLEIKPLRNPHPGWPAAVIWLTAASDSIKAPVSTAMTGSYALERQLEEILFMFDALPFPVWERNEECRITRINKAYLRAVDGVSEEQVIRDQVELFDSAVGQSPQQVAREVLARGETRKERQFSVINGQRRALLVRIMRLPDRPATLSTAVDVTGEEEALAELSRVLEAQSETLNRLHSPVAIFGPDKNLHFYNDAFAKLSSLNDDYLSSLPFHGELLEEMRARRRLPEQADFRAWKDKILARYTEVLEPVEDMWHLPDGTTHRLVTQPHPLGGLLLLFEDVTDQLTLQRRVKTLSAVQRETIDSLSEAIVVIGSDSRVTLYNRSFVNLMGMTSDYLDERPHIREIMESVKTEKAVQAVKTGRQILELIETHTAGQGRLDRASGHIIDYAVVPLPDGASLITQTDVTDTVRMESALRERNEALEAADRLKSEFITHASYDLRTPLNSIVGFAEMMKAGVAGELNDRQTGYLGDILEAANDLTELVDDMLDLAAIEAGTMELDIARFEVSALAREVIQDAERRDRSGETSVELRMVGDPGKMEGDQRRITSLLYNLLVATMRFAAGGEAVVFSVRPTDDGFVDFQARCRNTSLTPEQRDNVMTAFNTGRTAEQQGGLGLDLAIMRSFTAVHHGQVGMFFDDQEGLSVTCRLPRKQQAGTSGAINE